MLSYRDDLSGKERAALLQEALAAMKELEQYRQHEGPSESPDDQVFMSPDTAPYSSLAGFPVLARACSKVRGASSFGVLSSQCGQSVHGARLNSSFVM